MNIKLFLLGGVVADSGKMRLSAASGLNFLCQSSRRHCEIKIAVGCAESKRVGSGDAPGQRVYPLCQAVRLQEINAVDK